MYTVGIPDSQYRRANQVLGPDMANPIEYEAEDQGDGFYVFSFDVDMDGFQDIVILLKNNGITTIGADTELQNAYDMSERKITKLADLLREQPEYNQQEPPNRMESADDIITLLEKILETWETKEYESDEKRWNEYYLDIEEIVEDYNENKSIDAPDTDINESKVRNLIRKLIKQ
mgnify:CR=1 FL=1|tara:strand:+ start:402 stop:926 length:525 start_codon:yes stop_codon:yes gene_type:complete